MKEESTSALLRRICHSEDLEEFLQGQFDETQIPAFHIYIDTLCRKSGQVPERIIQHSGIERTYGHQLFNGTRKPSRDKVIQLAFGFGLNLEDTQRLLQIARKSPLYPKIKRDAAIIFCIDRQKEFWETQSVLHSLGLTLLGGE